MVFQNAKARAEASGQPVPEARAMGFGLPTDIAPIVVYLCSPRADHLRSQLFTFNGSKLATWRHDTPPNSWPNNSSPKG